MSTTTTPHRAGNPWLMLALATLGFAVNFWAWALISPLGAALPEARGGQPLGLLSQSEVALMVAVPVLVGSLGRIIVGALTDRFGGRVMFPIVSAATIVPVLFLAFFALDSYSLMLFGGFFLGIAGTAFAVGVPFVNAWFPPEKRGLAVGIFGAGMGGTAISALTTVPLSEDLGRTAPFLITAAVLAVYAVVAWLLMRDAPGRVAPTTSLTHPPRGQRASADHVAGVPALRGRLRWLCRVLGLPADLPEDRPRPRAGGRSQPDGRFRRGGSRHATGRRVAVGPAGVDPRAVRVVRRRDGVRRDRRAEPAGDLGDGTPHPGHPGVPGDGRCPGSRVRCDVRADRPQHRAGARGRRDGTGRRRRRARRVRAAAAHGLALRPDRVLRHRAVAARRDRWAHARADPARRTPHCRALRPRRSPPDPTDSRPDLPTERAPRDRPREPAAEGPDRRAALLHQGGGQRRRPHAAQDGGREGDVFYRDRWSHDKVVRSTHGVNCTGSCSWKVYVKDGIITWEAQQTDYPTRRARPPGVRAAWLPARRGVQLVHLQPDPGALPLRPRRAARDVPRGQAAVRRPGGRLGLDRAGRRRGGPTRRRAARAAWCAPRGTRSPRSSPPPTSTRSSAGARTGSPASRRSRRCRWCPTPPAHGSSSSSAHRCCPSTTGTPTCPTRRPQMFGDQTDVPESGDWWDAGYLMMWGSNVPTTRTPTPTG